MKTRSLHFVLACAVATLLLISDLAPVQAQPTDDYDIYVFNAKKGTTLQVTSIPAAGEFNPSFSNNGKNVVHDVLTSTSHDLYVTDVATGTSTALAGGDGGNDAAWSPNGKLIAFDRIPDGDPSLYVVPAGGGTRTLVRADAVDPAWSPNSKRLVFTDDADGSVRTIDVKTGAETTVAAFGLNPVWSPNGTAIAFTDGDDLYTVAVNRAGVASGAPVQITFDGAGAFNQQPSWSNNSRTIVFHSNRGGDFDLWTVPASGGTPALLTGLAGAGDFDPAYSNNGKLVAYAGVAAPAAGLLAALPGLRGALRAASFPNPFNPTTTISFTLPEEAYATVAVFDLLGKEVARLAADAFPAGTHEVSWDASRLPSGIYLYRVEAGAYEAVGRLVLLK